MDEIGVDGVQNLLLELPGVGRPLGARQQLRGVELVHEGVAQFDVVRVVILRPLPLDLVRAAGERVISLIFSRAFKYYQRRWNKNEMGN